MALLNDLSGREFIHWPLAVKAMIWITLFLFILICGYFLMWSGTIDNYNRSVNREESLKVTLKQKLRVSQGKKELQVQIQKINESFGELLKLLPTNASIENLIYDINQVGSSKGIIVKTIEGMGIQQKEYFAKIPAKIAFRTNFNELGRFVEDLSKLPRIVTLENFQIKRATDETSNAQIDVIVNANTYRSIERQSR